LIMSGKFSVRPMGVAFHQSTTTTPSPPDDGEQRSNGVMATVSKGSVQLRTTEGEKEWHSGS
jgi:hypothetical protein